MKTICHLKPSGGGFGGKGKGAVEMAVVETQRRDRNRRDDREGGRRDFKRKSNKIAETLKVKATNVLIVLLMKRKNGFVIRNKGDK